ncbi:MAG: hypothetical protein U5R06_12085 [candidate division KSB1 bacterium]|nr:hypothetical protein [candidate division KSB1 bacterium]
MYDISDPEHIGLVDTRHEAQKVAISGDHAFIADGQEGLVSVDVTNPGSPELEHPLYLGDYAYDVTLAGGYAYVAAQIKGLKIVDITDPANPSVISTVDALSRVTDVVHSGHYVFMVDGEEIRVIDVTDRSSPSPAASYDIGDDILDIAISNRYLYLGTSDKGFRILDVSQPDFSKPEEKPWELPCPTA